MSLFPLFRTGKPESQATAQPVKGSAFQALELGAQPVIASSFADPADVSAFRRCKAKSGTDQQCFRVGDNGLGKWGDDTTAPRPMCALPREDWAHLVQPRGARVHVTIGKRAVICELRDTMPARRFIKNGAGIDLNPEAARQLGLKPPFMVPALWRWL
jgi:hypothetical protein